MIKKLTPSQQLLNHILAMLGSKIITLVFPTNKSFKFDIDADGNIGYEKLHKKIFLDLLTQQLNHGGVLTIRQFTSLKTEVITPNDKKMWIPIKNLYSLRLGHGQWSGVSKEELEISYGYDTETGDTLTPEPSVLYKDIPEYFFK